jgi:HTH-type transcriptional regulator/antitoxin HigA
MIANERQYQVTKIQLSKLREALQAFDLGQAAKAAGSRVLAAAELQALESQAEELAAETMEYEALKSGAVRILRARSLAELPTLLIKARIAKGLSQRDLANLLQLKEQQIQRYEAGNYASASLRRLAEVAEALNLEVSEIAELQPDVAEETCGGAGELDWSRFPVDEMYKRNWFDDFFSGTLTEARANAGELVRTFVKGASSHPALVMLRTHVRSASTMDPYALLAWQCRVVSLAKQTPLAAPLSTSPTDERWLAGLVRLSSHTDWPTRVRDYLNASGIHLVIEPQLPHTYLDGAALLLPRGTRIVAMTLRYDRLDNFWFVLLHEVVHAVRHLRKGKTEDFLDDLDAEPDEVEGEADELACEALLPRAVWETALARYIRSEDSVRKLAEKLQMSPAIVAGRIRKEADDYTILTRLVGQGEVRKRFPEVKFAQ